jgi:hypothetical protein
MCVTYCTERLLEELAAAPTRAEAQVVLRQFQRRAGEDPLPEELLERIADVLNEKPE